LALVLAIAVVIAFYPPAFLVRALPATDLVSRFGKRSFANMLTILPEKAVLSEQAEWAEWTLTAPDADAAFSWTALPASGCDAVLRVDAAPFLAAKLDPERLPPGILQGDKLVFALMAKGADGMAMDSDGGEIATTATPMPDPGAAFARVLDTHRDLLAYHYQLGHYGIDVGGGNLLEWAGDPSENSLDLVFALDPGILEQAGLDKNNVDGWIAGSVIVHDALGRKVSVPKLLKPFDLLTKG
jgi:hypothetical protein